MKLGHQKNDSETITQAYLSYELAQTRFSPFLTRFSYFPHLLGLREGVTVRPSVRPSVFPLFQSLKQLEQQKTTTRNPRYSAPAYNDIPHIEHVDFGPKKYFHSCLHVGNKENLNMERNFERTLEMNYSGV